MSSSALKLLAASGAKGSATYVDDVFSTYVYDSDHGTSPIVNGINLADEGGLVWFKHRTSTYSNILFDTERGKSNHLVSNTTASNSTSIGLASFNTNGFSFSGVNSNVNSASHVAWTFRKAPGFFDVVTYTGNGANNRAIAHNLGSTPGFIIIKSSSNDTDWVTYHRSYTYPQWIRLNATDAQGTGYGDAWSTGNPPTSTTFTLGSGSFGDGNYNGRTYVAYLFAHDAQEFGTDSDESIIKCGSYTGNGSSTGPIIDLGFEPQWLMIKSATVAGKNWQIYDAVRGLPVGSPDASLEANTTDAESASGSTSHVNLLPYGFQLANNSSQTNTSGATYIYMAIRRPQKPAEEFAATDLFNVDAGDANDPGFDTGFPVDMGFFRLASSTSDFDVVGRLNQGKRIDITTGAEANKGNAKFDYMDGWMDSSVSMANNTGWAWRRAPGYFDVVAYTGTGSARTVTHNLGVAPEMMWVKKRNATQNWAVYANNDPTNYLFLNMDQLSSDEDRFWSDTAPTSSVFTVGDRDEVNGSGGTYIAYLFASVAGISKLGSYTGTGIGTTVDVDCGFSNGARFILIKRIDATGDWFLYDSLRGIVSGDSPYLLLNTTAAQQLTDYIDPLSSGFTVTTDAAVTNTLNVNGGTYIFYAIA